MGNRNATNGNELFLMGKEPPLTEILNNNVHSPTFQPDPQFDLIHGKK
jgi:hypothetical protein